MVCNIFVRHTAKEANLIYEKAKVYYGGSHHIAIPHTTRWLKPRRKYKEKEIVIGEDGKLAEDKIEPSVLVTEEGHILQEVEFVDGEIVPVMKKVKAKGVRTTKKEVFESLYKESFDLKRNIRRKHIIDGMTGLFKDLKQAEIYVDENLERKKRNLICRRTRLVRKVNLQNFNFFVTFTYDGKKHDENSFKQRLKETLSNFSNRRRWKYVGVWERSPEKKRLHFHGLFYIPDGTMPGELIEVNDFNIITYQRQITIQNTYFNEKFGRSDFEKIDDNRKMGAAVAYILKYIEKSGERIVYSRGLPQYFISDILPEDVVMKVGQEEKKLLLFDDFKCIDEGCIVGMVSEEIIKQMPKSN